MSFLGDATWSDTTFQLICIVGYSFAEGQTLSPTLEMLIVRSRLQEIANTVSCVQKQPHAAFSAIVARVP